MRYKRGENLYECQESKKRESITANNVIKWSDPGDFICYPLNDKGEALPIPFIAQPREFYKNFEKVD